MTTQDLINTLRQGCAITPRLSRELLARLSEQDRIISEIRAITALPSVPLVDLPGQIENLLSELADRQIQADIEPIEFVATRGGANDERAPG
jgi:hypothetical protein